MTQPDVTALCGATDLYAALAALSRAWPQASLAEVLQALGPQSAEAMRLAQVNQGLLAAVMADARGHSAVPGLQPLMGWLAAQPIAPMFQPWLGDVPTMALLTRGERPDMPAFSDPAFDAWFASQGIAYGLGAYGEQRSVYASDQFADTASPERRTIHLGVDVFAAAGTGVHAPLAGVVEVVTYNADPLDYGHTLILRHDGGPRPFWTLYGHLAASLPRLCRPGQPIAPGQLIAELGDWPENGGWAAHLHFQIITDRLGCAGNFFGVGHQSLWPIWQQISPDPDVILRLGAQRYRV